MPRRLLLDTRIATVFLLVAVDISYIKYYTLSVNSRVRKKKNISSDKLGYHQIS